MAEKNTVPNLEAKASKPNIYPKTMAGEIPAVYQTGTQNRYRSADKGRRYHRGRMDRRKRNKHPRRLHLGSGTGNSNNSGRVQNGTGQHQNQRPNPVVYRTLPPETQYIP